MIHFVALYLLYCDLLSLRRTVTPSNERDCSVYARPMLLHHLGGGYDAIMVPPSHSKQHAWFSIFSLEMRSGLDWNACHL